MNYLKSDLVDPFPIILFLDSELRDSENIILVLTSQLLTSSYPAGQAVSDW